MKTKRARVRKHTLERDPRFLRRVDAARKSLRQGRGTKIEDVNWQ